ncbi:alpha/beta fold hydrolase [Streptomyces albiaxialis]|uniref:Alpha/beta fold hydrolase n=1 Tax=Streptomyces albiaxialis TaxID=329523 RepID=A0ABP5HFB8_9ACTN
MARGKSTGIWRAGALALAAAVLAGACSGGSDDGGGDGTKDSAGKESPSAQGGGKLGWKKCAAPTSRQYQLRTPPKKMPDGAEWQCGKLRVPLDHAKPDGEKIDLALVRVRAKEKTEKKHQGSLVFNFGGPGASGVALLPLAAPESYDKLREGYDLVSFDPRGVGESAGVVCQDGKRNDADYAVESTPDDAEEVRTVKDVQKRRVQGCEKRAGKLLPHLTTENTARDMDLLRAALGDKKLGYFGISYGTQLGGVYARLFPERVGRMVLDAPIDPTLGTREAALSQIKGFELALNNYLKDCVKSATCPLGTSAPEAGEKLAALLEKIDKKPLATRGKREVTEAMATTGIGAALYSKETWAPLSMALQEAKSGQGDTLLALSDAYSGRGQDGQYTNMLDASVAVNCADHSARTSYEDAEKEVAAFREASAVFGPSQAWALTSCEGWPVRGKSDTVDVRTDSDAPVVVVGNTGDPATPYKGARKMTDALGGGARLLTFKGEGHGSYDTGDACVQKNVNGYLLDGKAPKDGTVCP